ncbi:MAG: serine/threonine-protein kinase [Myxococcales bacterium]|nr:serine/threonine-protein kinase [Myxococcales bacterium]
MPEVGDVVADKYEIVKLIGEGGMGSVFMASHTMTGKNVALKWMLPELATNEDAVQRFLREAQAAGRINHPNVVDIYDVGEHEGSPFLVMEYLHGEPLTDAMERGGLTDAQVIDIMLPCLRGVAAAHRKGVVHRDLKPDNIFLCTNEDGVFMQPKVLDFGISKLSGNDSHNPRLTRTGAVMGTPYYMSPEQIRGSHDVDGRCDVYAFGVILYEALTGQVPFNAETYSALVLEIATGTPTQPTEINPNLPGELAAVVMRAMAREPEDRYADVAALGVALEPFSGTVRFTLERMDPTGAHRGLKSGNITSTPFNTEHGTGQVPRKGGALALTIGGGVLVAAAAAAFLLLGGDKQAGSGDRGAAAPPSAELAGEPPAPALAPTEDPTPAQAPDTATAVGGDEGTVADGLPEGSAPPPPEDADAVAEAEAADAKTDKGDATKSKTEKRSRNQDKKAEARKRRRKTPRTTRATTVAAPVKKAAEPAGKKRGGRTGNLSLDDF